jgi:hypothetical protein
MLRLTDPQLAMLQELATPLQRWQRKLFVEAVARRQADMTELGDGAMHRVMVEAQREVLNASRRRGAA